MREIRRAPDFARSRCVMALLLALALGIPARGVRAATRVVAWGAGETVNPKQDPNVDGQSIVPTDLTNAVYVAGGWRNSLAVKADGTLSAWGDDSLGQSDFPADSNYVMVDSGEYNSLALKTDGTIEGAGDDFYGKTNSPYDLSNVVSIACGYYHGLALKSDGTVVAWGGIGSVNYGQGTVPDSLSNAAVVAIAAGGYDSLVLKSDGTVFAWGWDGEGETNIPSGLSNVVAIAAGAGHELALKADGTVVAWGSDAYGQTNVPANLSDVVGIAAGARHSLALKRDGTVVAWGAGNGSITNKDYGQSVVPAGLSNVVQIAAGDFHSLALVGSGPPVTQIVLAQPEYGTNGFSVSVPTRNGRVYQLEYKDSLLESAWHSLPLQAGTGGLLRLTDPAAVPQRFYRVLQW